MFISKIIHKMRSKASRNEGFSMVESVVGILLVTVGLVTTSSVLVTVAVHQKISDILTTATNIAEEELENLRNMPFSQIVTSEKDYGEITDHITFKKEVIVTPNGDDSLRTVEVTITHLGGQCVKFHTLIAR